MAFATFFFQLKSDLLAIDLVADSCDGRRCLESALTEVKRVADLTA